MAANSNKKFQARRQKRRQYLNRPFFPVNAESTLSLSVIHSFIHSFIFV